MKITKQKIIFRKTIRRERINRCFGYRQEVDQKMISAFSKGIRVLKKFKKTQRISFK